MSCRTTSLQVRAANQDNSRDASLLADLFQSYGAKLPVDKELTTREYWENLNDSLHANRRYTSLIVESEGRVLGHLSLQIQDDTTLAETFHFAVAPDLLGTSVTANHPTPLLLDVSAEAEVFEVASLLWECAQQQIIRAGKLGTLNYVPLQDPIGNAVAKRCFRGEWLSVVPLQRPFTLSEGVTDNHTCGCPILEGLADLRDSIESPRFREVLAGFTERI